LNPRWLLVVGSLVATAACNPRGLADAPHLEESPILRLTEEVRIGSLEDPRGAEAQRPVILFGDELGRELSHFGLPPETALQAGEWLGMHPAGDGVELRPTQVHIETWPDDRLDDYVLFRVTSDPPGSRLLFSGIDDLAPGPAVTVGEHRTLSVWEADRTVDAVNYTLNGVSYRVQLAASHEHLCDAEVILFRSEESQTLFSIQGEGTAEALFACDEPHFRIHWAGDLDGDGNLDLLVTFSAKYSHHPRQLFLSGGAAPDTGTVGGAAGVTGAPGVAGAGTGLAEPSAGAPGSRALVRLVAEYLPY
jgi:hypothetical protein